MQKYVGKLKPNVADIWVGDELWIKVKDDMKYLFVSMDDETRYLIGQEAADTNMWHAIYSAKVNRGYTKRSYT
jgi:putative transposase